MIVKKKKEGGFINPAYEKFERIMSFVVFFIILCAFLILLAWVVVDFSKTDVV